VISNGRHIGSTTFSDTASQFCLTIKSLLKLAGLDWPVPDFSTVSRRQKSPQVAIPCRPTTTGLHLLIDSTGIKID
jgi:hypothetical protein